MVGERNEAKQPIRDRVLQALCVHPLLSRRQLELYLTCPKRTAQWVLEELREQGWVQRYNTRQPDLHTRSLFAPTGEGIAEMARQAGVSASDYVRQTGVYPARLERLLVMMERAFQMRTIFLWLSRPDGGWRAQVWDVETARFFSAKDKASWIPFHGAAVMAAPQGGWASVVVEFDLRRAPVEGERLARFVEAQDDPRFWVKEKEEQFPVLIVIAQDEQRLQSYYTVLRAAALARQLPMPRAYLATIDAALTLRQDNTRPIWYSTISGRRVPLLFDTGGAAEPMPKQVPWRKMPLVGNVGDEDLESLNYVPPPGSPAALVLSLSPLEKWLLDEIAAHPLLTAKELAMLVQATLQRIRPCHKHLSELKLVETPRQDGRYLLAAEGMRYLTAVAGYGGAVRRYARLRGWGKGFDALVQHWEHTREENEFFLRLAAVARKRRHALTWLSELESRLYYELGGRRHSFLPDGRGTYIAGDRRYEFALEVDRSRAAQEKLRRKLAEYSACVNSNILRGERVDLLRVLILTTSWERSETLRRTAREFASADMPIFITTFDRLRASGADAAIWLRVAGDAQPQDAAYCFECFVPKPPRQPLPTITTYVS